MRFYRFIAYPGEGKETAENEVETNSRTRRVHNHKTGELIQTVNNKVFPDACMAVSDEEDGIVKGVIINLHAPSNQKKCLQEVQNVFDLMCRTLKYKCENVSFDEVTYDETHDILNTACREGFLEDDDNFLENIKLGALCGYSGNRIVYGEGMIEPWEEDKIRDAVKDYVFCKELTEELNRIFASKDNAFWGHPVQYLIQTDDEDNRRLVHRSLLRALWNKSRIINRRFTYTDIELDEYPGTKRLETLFHLNKGGALLLRIAPTSLVESDVISSQQRVIENICALIKKYQQDVLTVFCLPNNCDSIKRIFYSNLEGISVVELSENELNYEDSKDALTKLAKNSHVRVNKELFASLSPEKNTSSKELRSIFEKWYNQRVRKLHFSQYDSFMTLKAEDIKKAPKGSAYDELMSMTGLTEAKKVINQALDFYKAQRAFGSLGACKNRPAMNMLFTGEPGTCKTTVARLFAQILCDNHLLTNGELIEVGRSDLVGQYVGQTAPLVKKIFKGAIGNVLFIDEAYSLVDDRDGLYGDEAIATIVQEMENHRDDLVVIFAGYPDKMEKFLAKNPGLRSRIGFHVPFANYNADELCEITHFIARQKGLTLAENADEKLKGIFTQALKKDDFGNGRFARNLVEKAVLAQCSRLLKMDFESVTKKEATTLCAEDFPEVEMKEEKKQSFGFAV